MTEFRPLGTSLGAAVVVSVAFWVFTALATYNFARSRIYLYFLGGFLAGGARAIAFAVRASTINKGIATEGEAVVHFFFQGAGYGTALAVHIYLIGGWLRTTLPQYKPWFWAAMRYFFIALFPVVIALGPGLGLAGAILTYVDITPDRLMKAADIRKASATGMFLVSGLSVVATSGLTTYTMFKTGTLRWSMHKNPHFMILYVMPSSVLLCWASSFRLATVWKHPTITAREELFYPLQVLPELLQLAMWCIPTLFGRAYLSSTFDSWWLEKHGEAGPVPLFGFRSEIDKEQTGDGGRQKAGEQQAKYDEEIAMGEKVSHPAAGVLVQAAR